MNRLFLIFVLGFSSLAFSKDVVLYSTARPGASTNMALVQKTGQTVTYQTGDDGYYKKGKAWPSPRFVVTNVDCVVDNLTGLMWTKNANLIGAKRLWGDAIVYCEGLNIGGFDDWRLPNEKELKSLIDESRYNPAMPLGHPFTGVVLTDYYWASTRYAYNTEEAWFIDFVSGRRLAEYVAYRTYYVWPVRGGQ